MWSNLYWLQLQNRKGFVHGRGLFCFEAMLGSYSYGTIRHLFKGECLYQANF